MSHGGSIVTVNAFYSPNSNTMIVPIGMLQVLFTKLKSKIIFISGPTLLEPTKVPYFWSIRNRSGLVESFLNE